MELERIKDKCVKSQFTNVYISYENDIVLDLINSLSTKEQILNTISKDVTNTSILISKGDVEHKSISYCIFKFVGETDEDRGLSVIFGEDTGEVAEETMVCFMKMGISIEDLLAELTTKFSKLKGLL
jgi:hypothetical protein